jgi:DivIVA domain-containing protein
LAWHHRSVIWLALFVAVVVAVVTAAAVLGRVDGSLADATTTMSHVPLPEDQLAPADIDELRFDTAMRGYRMSQVDGVIDRLRREIADLDDELTRVRESNAALATATMASEPVVTAMDQTRPHLADQTPERGAERG